MPLYEYECLKCGERFERIQKFSDAILKQHPDCGGDVRKLLSAPAIQFKGTGWYVNDYGKGGKKPESQDESKSEAKAKTDSKAGSKSEAKSSGNGGSSGDSSTGKSAASESSKK